MNEEEIFKHTKDTYLRLIRPDIQDASFQEAITPLITLAPQVSDQTVAALVNGSSWRERLLGLCLVMTREPSSFIEPMLQSLRHPRGISIVPTCAALAVLSKRGKYTMPASFNQMFAREVFDGEIGWATDKAMHFVGLCKEEMSERGPNYGQFFENHAALYE